MSKDETVEISAEEFKEWTEAKTTKAIVNNIIELRQQLNNYLVAGNTVTKEAEFTTDRIVGRIEGITELFNMFSEVKEDAKEASRYDY